MVRVGLDGKEAEDDHIGQQGAGTTKWSFSSVAWDGQGGFNQADFCDVGLSPTHSGAQRNRNRDGQRWVVMGGETR